MGDEKGRRERKGGTEWDRIDRRNREARRDGRPLKGCTFDWPSPLPSRINAIPLSFSLFPTFPSPLSPLLVTTTTITSLSSSLHQHHLNDKYHDYPHDDLFLHILQTPGPFSSGRFPPPLSCSLQQSSFSSILKLHPGQRQQQQQQQQQLVFIQRRFRPT